jgi:hypothetical protein
VRVSAAEGSIAQAAKPKRTTKNCGARKPDELVTVAEIESGRKAAASTSPNEMIERAIASSPSLTLGIRRSVAILTT